MVIFSKTISKEVFVVDGVEYDTLEEAEKANRRVYAYMDIIHAHTRRSYRWCGGMSYSELAEKFGVWKITDEGPVDYGSSGIPSTLAYVKGTFEDAAKYAAKLPGFKGYGWGTINPVEIIDLTKKED